MIFDDALDGQRNLVEYGNIVSVKRMNMDRITFDQIPDFNDLFLSTDEFRIKLISIRSKENRPYELSLYSSKVGVYEWFMCSIFKITVRKKKSIHNQNSKGKHITDYNVKREMPPGESITE